ncbi:amidase [Marimonas arenosa]|uniref:Amidase family protein n=1 Tax=Marimonas arenosa TaxID=1795305 RepID=A0AAE3WBD9_9RHOB|nr:amidase family protein [Marimonas arenosa]MDQ2088585.1 amidase family protein [Marimonas arenosa]
MSVSEIYAQNDAIGLAGLVDSGEVSASGLLDAALARVAAWNPKLNAVVHIQEDVARAKIAEGLPKGPFAGVPFLIKDLGCEAVDFPTNNGSRLCAGMRWSYDSTLFTRMQVTGLNTFGRTTSPEFGIGPVTEAGVYGAPTRNPWNLNHTSGGSSGGSGAAVAAGIVPAAHGSDGGGSVRIPASSCGLVGFKPTRARLPCGPGSGEGWGGMAIDGFLTRSLRDTAVLLDATAGPELGAPYAAPVMEESFAQAMAHDPGQLRIRYTTTSYTGTPLHPDCVEGVEQAAKLMEDLGHVVDPWSPEETLDVPAMMQAWTKIVACGTAGRVAKILGDTRLTEDMVDGVTFGAVEYAKGVSGADYLAALGEIHAFGRRMAHAFDDCDILLSPTLAQPPCEIGYLKPDNADFLDYRNGPGGVFDYSPFTAIFNASGQPAVSLPLHWSAEGLPVGIHFAAPFGLDAELMSLCGQIERAAPWHEKQMEVIRRGA